MTGGDRGEVVLEALEIPFGVGRDIGGAAGGEQGWPLVA